HPQRDKVAGDETAQQKKRTGTTDLPPQPMQLCRPWSDGMNGNLESWRKQRTRIQPLIEQKLRRTAHLHPKIILVRRRFGSRTGYLLVQRTQRRGRKRGQMQIATYPNAALHPCVFVFQLKWLEADHERGYEIARVGGKDGHGYHFMDISTGL